MSRWTQEMDRALADGLAAGNLYAEVAIELGVTRNACIGRANRIGIRCDDWRGRVSRGTLRCVTRRFDHEAIRSARAAGASFKAISEQFGITEQGAGRIARDVVCPVNHKAIAARRTWAGRLGRQAAE